jgi:uncharacterized protein (TIGR03083 family)
VTGLSWPGPAIDVRALFGEQQEAFIWLLRDLRDDEWIMPTGCPGWSVKDIAAHVLGDHVSRLARSRDGHHGTGPRPGETLPVFLDRINSEWVTAARRMSPAVLIDLLSAVGDQVVAFWQTVDMDAAGEAVSWAGPDPAPVWLDAARDFSEYWTHQQQICDATGRTGPGHLGPVLDTFMRALPHTLRDITAPPGTAVLLSVTGSDGGRWTCVRDADRWRLDAAPFSGPLSGPFSGPAGAVSGPDGSGPDASVELDADTAWRLCTRGITPGQAAARARVSGDARLAAAALRIVSIIWAEPAPGSAGQEPAPGSA